MTAACVAVPLRPCLAEVTVASSLWLLSWNVNGLRAVLRKGGFEFLRYRDVDILCLQEARATADQVLADPRQPLFPDLPNQFFNPAEKRGYSGTAVFCAAKPIEVHYGMKRREHDREGRLLTLEFERFYLVNVYNPNAQRGLQRLEYRMRWDRDLRLYLKRLDRLKPVVFCGDLNVAHEEIDLAHPGSNHENAGFTDQEREGFSPHSGGRFPGQLSGVPPRRGPLLLVEHAYAGPGAQRRVAHRLRLPFPQVAPIPAGRVHPALGAGLRPLPGRHPAGAVTPGNPCASGRCAGAPAAAGHPTGVPDRQRPTAPAGPGPGCFCHRLRRPPWTSRSGCCHRGGSAVLRSGRSCIPNRPWNVPHSGLRMPPLRGSWR